MATVAQCTVCEWQAVMPDRNHAEHAKRVHERETDHVVVLEPA